VVVAGDAGSGEVGRLREQNKRTTANTYVPAGSREVAGRRRPLRLRRAAAAVVDGDEDSGGGSTWGGVGKHQWTSTIPLVDSGGAGSGRRWLATEGDWAAELWPWRRETSSRPSLGSSGGGYGRWW
jgi:hypothetical protein